MRKHLRIKGLVFFMFFLNARLSKKVRCNLHVELMINKYVDLSVVVDWHGLGRTSNRSSIFHMVL